MGSASAWQSSFRPALQRPTATTSFTHRFLQHSYSAHFRNKVIAKRRSCTICCHGGTDNFWSSKKLLPILSSAERQVNRVVDGHASVTPNGKVSKKGINGSSNKAGVEEGIRITRFLKGKCFLVTGATGFLAKVLIEKILRTVPDVDLIYVLIQAKDKESAMERMKREIVDSDLFGSLRETYGRNYQAFIVRKLVPVVGNVREENLGINGEFAHNISESVDVIVNSAANTTFDERYDVALDINTLGPCRLMSFARTFKKLKLFLQVSTAYVNGPRDGHVLEKPFCMGDITEKEEVNSGFSHGSPTTFLDIDYEIKLAFDSAKTCHNPTEIQKMKDLGMERARTFGWQDTYGFTKAMGEMLINKTCGDIPVVTIRPSVVESTYREPYPGWIEGNRMVDPIILYYGKGLITGFHVNPNAVLDIVPADMVVNATLAAIAKHGSRKSTGMHVYHVASSVKNPITFRQLGTFFYEHFNSNPILDRRGKPVIVPEMKYFDDLNEFSSYVLWYSIRRSRKESSTPSHEKLSKRQIDRCIKIVDQATHLASIYQPYVFFGARFDITNTEKLMEETSVEERGKFGFDVQSIDWKEYIGNIHIPGLRKHVMKEKTSITAAITTTSHDQELVAPAMSWFIDLYLFSCLLKALKLRIHNCVC